MAGPFYQPPSLAATFRSLPAKALHLYEEIARRRRADGTCSVPQTFFADLFGVSARRIRQLEALLERAGILSRSKRSLPEGGSVRTLKLAGSPDQEADFRSDMKEVEEQEEIPSELDADPRWAKVRRAVRSMGLQFAGRLKRALADRFLARRESTDAYGSRGFPEKSILEGLPWALGLARQKGIRRPENYMAACLVTEWNRP